MYADRDLPGAGGLAVRVIPCLDVDDGRVVKGVNFENLRDAGDPVELAAVYDAEGADELTFLDVTASSSGRATMLEVVRRTAEQVFIPLTVGGGVRTVADVDSLLRAGADKVAVNTAAIACPDLLADMARQFGSQCIVLSVDARTVPVGSAPTPSGWEVTTHGGRRGTGMDAVQWAARGADLGVGEILLNSTATPALISTAPKTSSWHLGAAPWYGRVLRSPSRSAWSGWSIRAPGWPRGWGFRSSTVRAPSTRVIVGRSRWP